MTESVSNKQIYTLHFGDECGFSELDVKRGGGQYILNEVRYVIQQLHIVIKVI